MSTMLNDEGYSFKELEQEIFRMVCEWGQVFTRTFLEEYDTYLMNNRDRVAYRNKGFKTTTIKTVYGEVTYQRRIYEVTREDGLKEYVFLLDEQLRIPGVGLISQNLADQLVSGITEMSYRECAAKITAMTGQAISPMGIWKTIQALGEKVCEEEQELVKAHKVGKLGGLDNRIDIYLDYKDKDIAIELGFKEFDRTGFIKNVDISEVEMKQDRPYKASDWR